MPREDVGDLLAFVAIARERSFTRAAGKLAVSQSALSRTISRFEERIGLRQKPAGTIRLTTSDHAANTILLP
jgi:hypothetical protein